MLVHKTGTTFYASVTRTTDAGAPVDLTGHTVTSKLRNRETGETYSLTAAVDSEQTNKVNLSATNVQTEAWPPGLYDWDVLFVKSGAYQAVPSFQNLLVQVVPGVSSSV